MEEQKYDLIVDCFLESLKNPLVDLLRRFEDSIKKDLSAPTSSIKTDDSIFTIPPLEENQQGVISILPVLDLKESNTIKTPDELIASDPIFDGILNNISSHIPERFRNSTLTQTDLVEICKALFALNLPDDLLKNKLGAFNLIEVPPSTEDLLKDDNFDYLPVFRMQEFKFQVLKYAVFLNSAVPLKVIMKGVVRVSRAPLPEDPEEFMRSELDSIVKEAELSRMGFSCYWGGNLQIIDVGFINSNIKTNIRLFNEADKDQKPRWFAEFGKFILSLKTEDGGVWYQYRSKFLDCFKSYFTCLGLTIDPQSPNMHRTQVKDCDFIYLENTGIPGRVFNILVNPMQHKKYTIKGLALVSK